MISALRRAIPYLRLYRNRIFVIAVDAGLFEDGASARAFLEQVAMLHLLGVRIVLVPAGGVAPGPVLELCRELGIEAVADVASDDYGVLSKALDAGFMPVVCAPESAAAPNPHAHAVALGAALGAEKLVFCAQAAGIRERPGDAHSLVSYTDLAGLKRLARAGCLDGGLLPDAAAIQAAIRGGVRRVHLISWYVRDSLLTEIFTNEGTGTMIVEDVAAIPPAEQQHESAVA